MEQTVARRTVLLLTTNEDEALELLFSSLLLSSFKLFHALPFL